MYNNRLWFEFRQRYKDCNALQSSLRDITKRRMLNKRFIELCFWHSDLTSPKKWELAVLAKAFGTRPDKILKWMNTFLNS